jgi:hypothetical protein
MAVYTIQVLGTCQPHKGHVQLQVKKDGENWRKVTVTQEDALSNDTEFLDVLIFFLRAVIKKAGATTLSQMKAAIEAEEWVV